MTYHFERKYKDRPDISVLVLEKSINPLEREDTRHDISDIAYFLSGYGFSVDLVWSIGNYKFDDFEKFCKSIVQELQYGMQTFKDKKYDDVRNIFERHTDEEIKRFKGLSNILRKTQINSIDDLATYDFLILHPDFEDCDKILPSILLKYPNKPIILPKASLAAGVSESYAKDFKIDDVKKDPRYEAVYIVDTDFDVELSVLTLMEYILDNTKKLSTKPQKS